MGTIRLAGLRKEYGGTVAVHGLTLEILEGEFLVLVGPSGCGKTTTLRMIAGLEEPTAGEIWIDGRGANDLEPGERDVGMVFQNLALFPHKTVFENIAFGLRVARMPLPEVRQRVEAVAATLHVPHLLHRMPGQLSGGEAQRVALARTLITEPKAYLLDEPLSNLDAKLRKEMRAEIDRLHRAVEKTFIYVTHDQEEAMTLADRIVVMRDGRIEQLGIPMEIYHDPANQFVASFFGSPAMNLIPGAGLSVGGRTAFAFAENVWPLDGLAHVPAGPATLGVRPEAVRVGDGARFIGQVTLVEPLGKETLVYLQYEPDRFLIAVAPGEFTAQEGATVKFDFQGARVYLFDALGRRIDAGTRPFSLGASSTQQPA